MWMSVLLVLSAGVSEAVGQTASVPPPSSSKCQPFQSFFCTGVGWVNATLPNLVGTTTTAGIEQDLALYLPLYTTACSNALIHFICALYYPVCFFKGNTHETLYPCRELCDYVRCSCDTTVRELGAEWPSEFECDNFPSSFEGNICYPGRSEFDFYRDKIRFPDIGLPHSEVTRCAAPTEQPTNDTINTSANSTVARPKCPVARVTVANTTAGYQRYQLAGYQECGQPCDPSILTGSDVSNLLHILILIVSLIAGVMLSITIATIGIDRKRFPYPQRPFAFIALNYLIVALVTMISNIHGLVMATPWCDIEGNSPVTMQGQPLSIDEAYTTEIGGCSVMAFFLYYTNMAALSWWVVLSFTWFLATALKWAEEAIAKFWLLYHALAWGIPLIQVIFVLVFHSIDAELPSHVCYVGNSDLTALGTAVFLPTLVYTAIGGVFYVVSITALSSIYRSVREQKEKGVKVRPLLIRVTTLGLLILIPNSVLLSMYVYEMSQRTLWERHVLCQHATPTELETIPECTLPRGPAPNAYFVLKYVVLLVPSLSVFTWIVSWKTIGKWGDFGKTLLVAVKRGCGKPSPHSTAV